MEITPFNISENIIQRTKNLLSLSLNIIHSSRGFDQRYVTIRSHAHPACVSSIRTSSQLSRLTDRELLRISLRFYICIFIAIVQKSQEVSRVQPPAKWAGHPAASADTPIPTTAESITYVWKVSRESTGALSALCSRSVMPMAAVPAKILRTFLDGESLSFFFIRVETKFSECGVLYSWYF